MSTLLSWLFGLALFCGAGSRNTQLERVCVPTDQRLFDMRPLAGMRICIDAGHGGQATCPSCPSKYYTGGAWGAATCQREGDVNLRVAMYTRDYLYALGAQEVIMTRDSDVRVSKDGDKKEELLSRPKLAEARGADLFVSLHHNWANDSRVNYSVVYYSTKCSNGAALALAQSIGRELGQWMPWVPAAKPRPGDYAVLNASTKMPAVLVEYSFMSNVEEDLRLANADYNQRQAWATARGISCYALQYDWMKLSQACRTEAKKNESAQAKTAKKKAPSKKKKAHARKRSYRRR